jgi:hypothetical protein
MDLTTNAVQNQLKAFKCSLFQACLLNFKTGHAIYYNKLTFHNIIKLLKFFKFKNYNFYNIYIGPDPSINRALILIDDINLDTYAYMSLRGVEPAILVETSPNNYQAWVNLGLDPMLPDERKAVSRVFAKEFNGDPGSVGSDHLGRLAGFTNRKDKYCINNIYPFVICRKYNGLEADKSLQIRLWAKKIVGKSLIQINDKISVPPINVIDNANFLSIDQLFYKIF